MKTTKTAANRAGKPSPKKSGKPQSVWDQFFLVQKFYTDDRHAEAIGFHKDKDGGAGALVYCDGKVLKKISCALALKWWAEIQPFCGRFCIGETWDDDWRSYFFETIAKFWLNEPGHRHGGKRL